MFSKGVLLKSHQILVYLIAFFMVCGVAHAQVVNGTFTGGGAGWTAVGTANGTLVFNGTQAVATSANAGGGQQRTYASQSVTIPDVGFLSYSLVSYTTTDIPPYDYPMVLIGTTFFWLDQTTGALTATATNNIDNADAPISINGVTTLPVGTTTIGFGATATDSCCGPGVATWDNIVFQQLTNSPTPPAFNEDTTFPFSGGNAFSVATNSGAASMTVTMTATNGNLSISTGTGLITGGSNSSPTFTLTGSPAAINAALASMTYTPTLNYNGSAQVTFDATGGGLSDTDIVPLTVTAVPDYGITVSKSASPASISTVGGTISYIITVQNTGDTNFTSVVLTDILSQGVNDTSITLTGPTTDIGTAGALDPSETWTFNATHDVTQAQMDDGGNLVNNVTVATAELGPSTGNAQDTTTLSPNASLDISKSADIVKAVGNTAVEAEVGDTINYEYLIENDGNQTITAIDISDIHNGNAALADPSPLMLQTDVVPTGDSTDANGADAIWSILAPGDIVLFTTSYVVTQTDIDVLQ